MQSCLTIGNAERRRDPTPQDYFDLWDINFSPDSPLYVGRAGLFVWTPHHDAALAQLTRLQYLKINVNPLFDMPEEQARWGVAGRLIWYLRQRAFLCLIA